MQQQQQHQLDEEEHRAHVEDEKKRVAPMSGEYDESSGSKSEQKMSMCSIM